MKFINRLRAIVREESGQDLLEYALLVALIAIVAVGAVTLAGTQVQAIFNQVDTTLFCTACNAETAHRILYLGHRLAEARCADCGRAIGMSREEVFSDFVGEVVLHMLYLPPRVRRELRTDFSRAIQTLPREMVRMPYHLARDFIRLVRILRAPRGESEGPPSVGAGSK